MKKILFFAVAVVATMFASCGNSVQPSGDVEDTAVIDTVDTIPTDTVAE